MIAHRPTTLQLYQRHCPRAVDHYEAGTPQDRRIFGQGTAAHEVLHAIAEGRDVDKLCHQLITQGRIGIDAEPALAVDDVIAGRELAERWAERYPPPEAAEFERRFAFDRDWQITDSDPWFATRIDVVECREEGDEDHSGLVVTVDDYKSSWQATETELDTLQRRAQAVVAWLTWPDAVAIRISVSNLRRLRRYERLIELDDDGIAMLSTWRDQVDALCRALDTRTDGRRSARPGIGCGACPYAASCDDARAWEAQIVESPEDLARQWRTSHGRASALGRLLRGKTASHPIQVDGFSIGHHQTTSRSPRTGAGAAALIAWLTKAGGEPDPDLASRISSYYETTGEPGLRHLDRASKAIHSRRDDRILWLDGWTEETTGVRFSAKADPLSDK